MGRSRTRLLLIVATLASIGGGVYLLAGRDDRAAGQFPELQPDVAAPPGYEWKFRDGPDFYVWVLSEPTEGGKRANSGVGVYVGQHPNPSTTAGADGRVVGHACGRDVTWLVERSDVEADTWVRWDVVFEYTHGPGYTPVNLHLWVWGPSDAVVAGLAAHVSGLTFSPRKSVGRPG
jgi:hypothetical protein